MPNETTNTPGARPVPDWVNETPEDCSYDLTMFEPGGGHIQDIELTRDEYIQLKQYLAVMRNHPVAQEPWGEAEWALLERAYGALKQLCG